MGQGMYLALFFFRNEGGSAVGRLVDRCRKRPGRRVADGGAAGGDLENREAALDGAVEVEAEHAGDAVEAADVGERGLGIIRRRIARWRVAEGDDQGDRVIDEARALVRRLAVN